MIRKASAVNVVFYIKLLISVHCVCVCVCVSLSLSLYLCVVCWAASVFESQDMSGGGDDTSAFGVRVTLSEPRDFVWVSTHGDLTVRLSHRVLCHWGRSSEHSAG